MPIAEFTCPSCGNKFEKVILRFAEYEKTIIWPCPKCDGKAVKTEFPTTLPPMFYGSGWTKPSATKRDSYKTISRKEGNFNEK